MKIYLSHEPEYEVIARRVAEVLRTSGHEVIVAADVRPHKDYIHDENDMKVVAKVIKSCDVMIMVGEMK